MYSLIDSLKVEIDGKITSLLNYQKEQREERNLNGLMAFMNLVEVVFAPKRYFARLFLASCLIGLTRYISQLNITNVKLEALRNELGKLRLLKEKIDEMRAQVEQIELWIIEHEDEFEGDHVEILSEDIHFFGTATEVPN